MSFIASFKDFCTRIQHNLLPLCEKTFGILTEKHEDLIKSLELLDIDSYFPYAHGAVGRPACDRAALAKCFIAKSIFGIYTTKSLIDRLKSDYQLRQIVGFNTISDIPGESSFSRAFAEFAQSDILTTIHTDLIKQTLGERLVVGHISRDSTAIEAREKPVQPPEIKEKKKKKRGRRKKDEAAPPVTPRMLELQRKMGLKELLSSVPTLCNVGTKKNAKGYKTSWIGYKFHIDSCDSGIPVSCIISSASLHDSQAALPLAALTRAKVNYCYELMDSAYDAPEIHEEARKNGKIALIDTNPRNNKRVAEAKKQEKKARETIKLHPAEAIRYNERTTAERTNAFLKDWCGGRNIFVKGAEKVLCHLMCGILSITALQLFRIGIT